MFPGDNSELVSVQRLTVQQGRRDGVQCGAIIRDRVVSTLMRFPDESQNSPVDQMRRLVAVLLRLLGVVDAPGEGVVPRSAEIGEAHGSAQSLGAENKWTLPTRGGNPIQQRL